MNSDSNSNVIVTKFNDKSMTIGILGAPINNGNMGCVALTYSLLSILEEIANDLGAVFTYYDFEGVEDLDKTHMLCRELGIKEERVKSFNIYPVESFLGLCHRPYKGLKTYHALKKCDLFIDLTQGDSFSDIYGDAVFSKNVNGKLLIEKKINKPLILGPQTYGPYENEKNREKAKEVIEKAAIVIARDAASAQYVKSFTDKEVHTTTDLAFRLPYKNGGLNCPTTAKYFKKKVGVNISGLLSKNKMEATPTKFHLKTDYDAYIKALLSWLINDAYDVSLIPHVAADYECGKFIAEKFPQVKLVEMPQNPMDIKRKISECDIFIGARMHATIGAFSSGVATIPTAYSRKFNGLYESVGYPYIVDLLNLSTEENLEKTKKYVKNYVKLNADAEKSLACINLMEKQTISLLKEQIGKRLNV